MALLRRSLKYVAVSIGVLLGLLAVAAASIFAYGEAESDRVTALPEPTDPYGVGRTSYHWTDRSREEAFRHELRARVKGQARRRKGSTVLPEVGYG